MASTAAANLSSTGNFSATHYDEFIQATMQEYGRKDFILDQYLTEVEIPDGHSNSYKIVRKARIPTPLVGLTESITPSATTLTTDTVSGTTVQYGIVCSFSDIANKYQLPSMKLLKIAGEEIKDAMLRLRQWVAAQAYMALTNVVYPGSVTARGSLAATDVLDTATMRVGQRQLATGLDTKLGAPRPWPGFGMLYPFITHPVPLSQLRGDAVFEKQATQSRPELLEKGVVKEWEGFAIIACNHLPVLTNIGTGMAANSITSGGTEADDSTGALGGGDLSGFRATINAAGALADAVHYCKVVARHRWLGFEAGISSRLTLADTNDATSGYDFVMPTDTDYIYDLYFGDTDADADLFLASATTGLAAAATVTVSAERTTGTAAPVSPAKSVVVYPSFAVGVDWAKMPKLMPQETYVVTGADKSDILNQQTYVGAKAAFGSFVSQDDFALRFETGSSV